MGVWNLNRNHHWEMEAREEKNWNQQRTYESCFEFRHQSFLWRDGHGRKMISVPKWAQLMVKTTVIYNFYNSPSCGYVKALEQSLSAAQRSSGLDVSE